jgi:hypothetical protein
VTPEEAEVYTRNSADLAARISEHFSTFGATMLSLVEKIVEINQDSVELFFQGKSWGLYTDPKHIPFMLGVLHDFSTSALAKIFTALDIDPIAYIDSLDYNDEKIPSLSNLRVDSRVLSSKMIEAYCFVAPAEARATFAQNIDHSSVALAFLAGSDFELVADGLLEAEYRQIRAGKPLTLVGGRPLQANVSELPAYLEHPEHLPNRSAIEFFERAGSFNTHVVRKTLFQSSCWENLLVLQGYPTEDGRFTRSLLDAVMSPRYLAVQEDQVRMMLSNITMDTTEYEHDYHDLVNGVLGWIKTTPLKDYAEKITFGLSLTRNYLRYTSQPVRTEDLFCGAAATGVHCLEFQQSLVKKGRRTFQAVIDETLDLPDGHIGFHHLTVPWILKKLVLPGQIVKKDTFEAYLVKVAKVSSEFEMEGNAPDFKSSMDRMIDDGMSHWIRELGRANPLNVKKLDLEDDKIADQLVRWGVGIALIPNPTDKSMSSALERDLGL